MEALKEKRYDILRINSTLELLRPKVKLCNSLEESIRQVQDLEREFLIKLGKQLITERK